MGQLVRNRRLGRGRVDWPAVRRDDAGCVEAFNTCARGRRRICDPDRHSFRQRAAPLSTLTRSMELDHFRVRSLGPNRRERVDIHGDRRAADALADTLPTGIRGLVVPPDPAPSRIRNARDIGIRSAATNARGPVRRRSRVASIAIHRHPQRVGQRRKRSKLQ